MGGRKFEQIKELKWLCLMTIESKLSQPNSVVLVSFFSDENALSNYEAKTCDTFGLQSTENPHFRFLWTDPGFSAGVGWGGGATYFAPPTTWIRQYFYS